MLVHAGYLCRQNLPVALVEAGRQATREELSSLGNIAFRGAFRRWPHYGESACIFGSAFARFGCRSVDLAENSMRINPTMSLTAYILTFLLLALQSACGSSTYLIDATYLANPNPQGVPAQSERTGESLFVSPRKLHLDGHEPLPPELRDVRLRVTPRRPTGLLIAGAITFGIGAALTLGGVAELSCPPNALCENGVALGTLLGLGSVHMLIGGIQLIAAGAKWSPEVSAPRAW